MTELHTWTSNEICATEVHKYLNQDNQAIQEMAGYRMPSTVYTVNAVVKVPYQSELALRCTQAGTTASGKLATLTEGTVITDGTVKWLVESAVGLGSMTYGDERTRSSSDPTYDLNAKKEQDLVLTKTNTAGEKVILQPVTTIENVEGAIQNITSSKGVLTINTKLGKNITKQSFDTTAKQYITDLGAFSGKTVTDLKNALVTWLGNNVGVGASAKFNASDTWVTYWNSGATTALSAGKLWTVTKIADYGVNTYATLIISAYTEKAIYRVVRSAGAWKNVVQMVDTSVLSTALTPYGKVKSVNSVTPDTAGNVELELQQDLWQPNEAVTVGEMRKLKGRKYIGCYLVCTKAGTTGTTQPTPEPSDGVGVGGAYIKSINGVSADDSGNIDLPGYIKRNTAYSVGDIVYSSQLPAGYYLECVTAGTTSNTEPTIDITGGGAVIDGTATFEANRISSKNEVTTINSRLAKIYYASGTITSKYNEYQDICSKIVEKSGTYLIIANASLSTGTAGYLMNLDILMNGTSLLNNRTISQSGGGLSNVLIANLKKDDVITLNSYSYIPNESYKIYGNLYMVQLA